MIFYNIGRSINIFANFTTTLNKVLNKITLFIKRNNQNN